MQTTHPGWFENPTGNRPPDQVNSNAMLQCLGPSTPWVHIERSNVPGLPGDPAMDLCHHTRMKREDSHGLTVFGVRKVGPGSDLTENMGFSLNSVVSHHQGCREKLGKGPRNQQRPAALVNALHSPPPLRPRSPAFAGVLLSPLPWPPATALQTASE